MLLRTIWFLFVVRVVAIYNVVFVLSVLLFVLFLSCCSSYVVLLLLLWCVFLFLFPYIITPNFLNVSPFGIPLVSQSLCSQLLPLFSHVLFCVIPSSQFLCSFFLSSRHGACSCFFISEALMFQTLLLSDFFFCHNYCSSHVLFCVVPSYHNPSTYSVSLFFVFFFF